MAQQPPSSGPARQPLQTYLATPVRPTVAQPVQQQQQQQQQQQPQQQQQAQQHAPQLFPPHAGTGLFSAPPLFAAPASHVAPAAPVAGAGAEHLSSLLQDSAAPGTRTASVFRDMPTPPPEQAQSQQQQQQQQQHASRPSVIFPPGSPSAAGQSGSSHPLSVSSSPTPAQRLEQTFEHPLLGGGPAPPPQPQPAPSPQPAGGIVLPGPLGPLGHPRPQSQQTRMVPRAASMGQGSVQTDGTTQQMATNTTAPPSGARTSPAQSPSPSLGATQQWSAQQALAQQQQQQQQQQQAQLQQQQQQQQYQHQQSMSLPTPSPDEKLSTLLSTLFDGEPPPSKLASFDVSAVSQDEAGLEELATRGFWREVLKLAETLLDIPRDASGQTAKGAGQTGAGSGSADPVHLITSVSTASTSTRPPHISLRILHYYVSALCKLRKFDLAHAAVQTRLGSLFSADKLYASHPQHYNAASSSAAEAQAHVGNMVPFELLLLASELPHLMPGSPRTRYALDQLMKLVQMLRAQMARKKGDQALAAAATNGNGGVGLSSPSPPPPQGQADLYAKRESVSESHVAERQGSATTGPTSTGAGTISSSTNPFSLTSPHTLSPLSLAQLASQLRVVRLHVVNLCLSFPQSLDVDFEQALAWLEELQAEMPPEEPLVLEALVRVHLQVGDVARAEGLVEQLKAVYARRGEPEHENVGLNIVLLHLARNEYAAAHALAASLYASHPASLTVANNYAVCSLYVPDGMQEGIRALEGLIKQDPIRNLQESVLSNLRALYDLSSSNPSLKRRMLEGLVLMYGSDDLDASS